MYRTSFRRETMVPECLAHYQERLKAEGWTLQPPSEMDGSSFLLKGRKDSQICTVLMMPSEGETVVQIQASVE